MSTGAMDWPVAAVTTAIVAFVLGSIAVANVLFDRGVPQYLSRKVAHVAAGVAFLISPATFDGPAIPIGMALGFTALMAAGRRWKPEAIRGVGGTGREHAIAEIWYPFACAIALAIGWGLLHDPWLGVLPTLFLAFGDAVTGAVRLVVYKREVKGALGSVAMLIVCAGLAFLVHPYWIGLTGAIVATILEYATPATPRWDDNPALTIGSAVVMGLLYWGFVLR
jgi:phytol kinase